MSGITYRFNSEPLRRYAAKIKSSSRGPVRKMLDRWGTIYLDFVRDRFERLSRSGGGKDWPPLQESTITRRRGEGIGVGVLWDTGTLLGGLSPGGAGNLFRFSAGKQAVEVGYGGQDRHPKAPLSIAELARIHDEGKGDMPRRRILVEPNLMVERRFVDAAADAFKQAGKEAELGL